MQGVLGVHLFHELTRDGLVRNIRVGPGSNIEWRILEDRNVRPKVTDELGGKFTLFGDSGGEFARVILNVLWGS